MECLASEVAGDKDRDIAPPLYQRSDVDAVLWPPPRGVIFTRERSPGNFRGEEKRIYDRWSFSLKLRDWVSNHRIHNIIVFPIRFNHRTIRERRAG